MIVPVLPGENSCVNQEIPLPPSFLRCPLLQLDDPEFIRLPIPNDHVLPPVEQFQIHEVLSRAQDQLATLDLDIARAKAIYDALLTKREKLRSRMERLQAMVAPQKSLPDEILAEIFVLAASRAAIAIPPILTHYRDICPWILTRVCSRWRLVALNEPRLWTRVQFSGFYMDTNPKPMPAAEEVLRRGGRLLVELTVHERASAKLFLSIIVPHLNRVKTLRLDVSAPFMTDFLSLPPVLCALEEITVNTSDIGLPSTSCRIFEGAHSLCHFTLGRPSNLVGALRFPHLCFPWNQLTSLVFEHVFFDSSTFHKVLSQCTELVTLTVVKITVNDFDTEGLDKPDTIFLPHLESLELLVHPVGQVPSALRSLVVPVLSRLSFGADYWGLDNVNLFAIADMLHRSSSPLIDLQIMVYHNVEEDIGPILECCPRLLYLRAPMSYLELPTIQKITHREWVPNIEVLRCRIHHHIVDAFLDMLETKWEGEIGLPEADRRLMSDVGFFVDGPDEAEQPSDRPNHPLISRLNRIQERLGRRRVEVYWINETA